MGFDLCCFVGRLCCSLEVLRSRWLLLVFALRLWIYGGLGYLVFDLVVAICLWGGDSVLVVVLG